MRKTMSFIFRLVLLSTFVLCACITLINADEFTSTFRNQYLRFEKAFTRTTRLGLPSFVASSFMQRNGEFLIKAMAWANVVIGIAAMFGMPSFTALAGLVHFVMSLMRFFTIGFSLTKDLAELLHLSLSLALFAASIAVSLPECRNFWAKVRNCCRWTKSTDNAHSRAEQGARRKG